MKSTVAVSQRVQFANNIPGLNLLRFALLAFAISIASSSMATAQAGQLDPSFATGGIFQAHFQLALDKAIAIQADGKIVVAGTLNSTQAVLIRLNTDGTLDPSFGSGGIVNADFNDDGSTIVGLAIQPDGKILAAADRALPPGFVVRYKSDGTPDTAFGKNGIANLPITHVNALALQPDGKILGAGLAFMIDSNTSAVGRLDANGQVDKSFGSGGMTLLPGPQAVAIALQKDGKILTASPGFLDGQLYLPESALASPQPSLLTRLKADGRIDASFGVGGQVACLADSPAIAVQSDGKILAAGSVVARALPFPPGNNSGFGVLRYNSDGSIDSSFGKHGGSVTSFTPALPEAAAFTLAVQTNGDIVVAGLAGQPVGNPNQPEGPSSFALARFTPRGQLDTTFGSGGKVFTTFGNNTAWISALGIQTDGKVVAAGNNSSKPQQALNDFAVARYLAQ